MAANAFGLCLLTLGITGFVGATYFIDRDHSWDKKVASQWNSKQIHPWTYYKNNGYWNGGRPSAFRNRNEQSPHFYDLSKHFSRFQYIKPKWQYQNSEESASNEISDENPNANSDSGNEEKSTEVDFKIQSESPGNSDIGLDTNNSYKSGIREYIMYSGSSQQSQNEQSSIEISTNSGDETTTGTDLNPDVSQGTVLTDEPNKDISSTLNPESNNPLTSSNLKSTDASKTAEPESKTDLSETTVDADTTATEDLYGGTSMGDNEMTSSDKSWTATSDEKPASLTPDDFSKVFILHSTATSETEGDTSLPSTNVEGDTSLPSTNVEGDTSLPSTNVEEDTSLPSTNVEGDSSLHSTNVEGGASSPSTNAEGDKSSPTTKVEGDKEVTATNPKAIDTSTESATTFPTAVNGFSASVATTIKPLDEFTTADSKESTTPEKGNLPLGIREDHVIRISSIKTARVIVSVVFIVIALVGVAILAVYMFKVKRAAVQYDQLMLLP